MFPSSIPSQLVVNGAGLSFFDLSALLVDSVQEFKYIERKTEVDGRSAARMVKTSF